MKESTRIRIQPKLRILKDRLKNYPQVKNLSRMKLID